MGAKKFVVVDIYCQYVPDALVYHPARKTFREHIDRSVRIFGGEYQKQQKRNTVSRSIFLLRAFTPPVRGMLKMAVGEKFRNCSSGTKIGMMWLLIVLKTVNLIELLRLSLLGHEARR